MYYVLLFEKEDDSVGPMGEFRLNKAVVEQEWRTGLLQPCIIVFPNPTFDLL